ncbi:MAG: aldehyde dehydrogenase family protein [Candidatus Methylomirabilales bacterium]
MRGKNYIGGRWLDAHGGTVYESRNPAKTDEIIGTVPMSHPEEAEKAVAAAKEAFPAWRALSRIKRGEFIDQFVDIVKSETEEIARLVAKEAGKGINEARADVIEGIHMAQYIFGYARMPHGQALPSEIADKDAYMIRKPKGVVAVITPWNFPFAIPIWLITPSLLQGNTVVFKPSEETPVVGEKIVECFERAGLPPGVLNLVQGMGEEAGWPLVVHPDVEVVLFTGSYEVGSRIKEACAKDYRKMCACEMGGKNAMIICQDANLELAVRAAILSAFKTTGQRCTSASRLIVHEGRMEEFSKAYAAMTKRIVIGDPLDEQIFMGPLINEAAVKKVSFYNQLAKKEGAEVVIDGGRIEEKEYRNGYFFSPFIYRMAHRRDARVLHEEVFGPHVALIPFRTLEEAVEIHNDVEYGLSFSVITEDYRAARFLQEACEFGIGYWNLPTIGAEVHLPFGGVKRSGTGMPASWPLLDVVTHKVAWTVSHGQEIKMAQGMSAEV